MFASVKPRFPPYATIGGKLGHYALAAFSIAALLFLMAPVLVVVPLAFNAEPYFTYPIHRWSLKWFHEFFTDEVWQIAVKNSFVIAISATVIATSLGTLASVGLTHRNLPGRAVITAILVSPMIVPIVIVAVGVPSFSVQ
ncbi:MAG: ABC transporter permease [Longimicrobiales bacterium]